MSVCVYVRIKDSPLIPFFTILTHHTHTYTHIHPTEVPAHPFEVTEKGWGEFEAGVSLNFKDAHEKSVEFRHQVKLFHGNSATAQPNNKKVSGGDGR